MSRSPIEAGRNVGINALRGLTAAAMLTGATPGSVGAEPQSPSQPSRPGIEIAGVLPSIQNADLLVVDPRVRPFDSVLDVNTGGSQDGASAGGDSSTETDENGNPIYHADASASSPESTVNVLAQDHFDSEADSLFITVGGGKFEGGRYTISLPSGSAVSSDSFTAPFLNPGTATNIAIDTQPMTRGAVPSVAVGNDFWRLRYRVRGMTKETEFDLSQRTDRNEDFQIIQRWQSNSQAIKFGVNRITLQVSADGHSVKASINGQDDLTVTTEKNVLDHGRVLLGIVGTTRGPSPAASEQKVGFDNLVVTSQ